MRPNYEIQSVRAAANAISKGQPTTFQLQVGGYIPDPNNLQYLAQLHPSLFSMMEYRMSGFHLHRNYNPSTDITTLTFDHVKYADSPQPELLLHAKGWNGFRQAFALFRAARCTQVAIVVELGDAPETVADESFLQQLLDRYTKESTQSDIMYGDPMEYGQRSRAYSVRVRQSAFRTNSFIFRIECKQYESFGLRIGLQAEICKLNHSLFHGQQLTDREKVLRVNRWMRENITYLDEDKNADHSAAVTFLRKEGVCQGFASLVIATLQLENIPTLYVRGNITETGSHAWNLIKLDGRWLHLDSTWGIHYSDAQNPYLLRTDETFPKHTWDRELYSVPNNEKRAAAIQRLRRREFTFRPNDHAFRIDQTELVSPDRVPLIRWGDRMMIDMISLFRFLNMGYSCEHDLLTIYTRERTYSFPVADENKQAPCQALRLSGNLFISAEALSQIPGFSYARFSDCIMILTG